MLCPSMAAIRRLFERLAKLWVFRSLAMGAIATSLDLAVLLTGVELLDLPRVPCVLAGVCTGATTGFLLNRSFVFAGNGGRLGLQAIKYGVCVAGELSLHTACSFFLIEKLGVPYLIAKFSSDAVIMNALHLVLLRHVVFPATESTRASAMQLPVTVAAPEPSPMRVESQSQG
jgi:putative flippase GtrA